MILLTWGPRCELLSADHGQAGAPHDVSGLLRSLQASRSMTSLSTYSLGTVTGPFFQMWNLSAKWSQLKYQLRFELPFSFCWLYPLLLLPDQVSLCLSQTCRHLEVFILCFGCVDLCVAKFRCPSHSQPQQWSEILRETILGLWASLAATVQLETSRSAYDTQGMLYSGDAVQTCWSLLCCTCCYQAEEF